MIFFNAILLVFLTLGLSSSIAHAYESSDCTNSTSLDPSNSTGKGLLTTQAGKLNNTSSDGNKKGNVAATVGAANSTSADGNKKGKDAATVGAANSTSVDCNEQGNDAATVGAANSTSADGNKKGKDAATVGAANSTSADGNKKGKDAATVGAANSTSVDCNEQANNGDASTGKADNTSNNGNKKGNAGDAAAGKADSTSNNGNKKDNSVDSAAAGKANNTSADGNKKGDVAAASNKSQTQDNGNVKGKNNNNGNPQTSLCLDPSVIAKGFEQNGQQNLTEPDQVASLTSSNNFINFCATSNLPLTNGKQIKTGSCNPAPMGLIPSTKQIPTSKFQSPKNLDVLKANTAFNVTMKIQGLETGNFVNAVDNYYSAPQQLNAQGQIIGHSHVVIQKISSIDSTDVLDANTFAFFKGLNAPAVNGLLTAEVTGGLAAGTYRLSSINTAANHQPCLPPLAQRGSIDDQTYFTVTADGKADSTAAAGDAANNGKNQTGNANSKAASNAKGGNGTANASGDQSKATNDSKAGNGTANASGDQSKAANDGKAGNGTANASGAQSKAADNGKGSNGTGNTSGGQSTAKSQSQQSAQQQGKDNGNNGGAAKGQQATASTYQSGRRRHFRLEVRKDAH